MKDCVDREYDRLERDLVYRKERLSYIQEGYDLVQRSGILSLPFQPYKRVNIERFLVSLATNNITLRLVPEWGMAYEHKNGIRNWFNPSQNVTIENTLNTLKDIEDYLDSNDRFETPFDQMVKNIDAPGFSYTISPEGKEHIKNNITILRQSGSFYLHENPSNPIVADHVAPQHFENHQRDLEKRHIYDPRAFQDPAIALNVTKDTNDSKTEGAIYSYPDILDMHKNIGENYENLLKRMIKNPIFLANLLAMSAMFGETPDYSGLYKTYVACNVHATEKLAQYYKQTYNIKVKFIESMFFEFLITTKMCTRVLHDTVMRNKYTFAQIEEAVTSFRSYREVVSIIGILYCDEQTFKKILKPLQDNWKTFLNPLKNTYPDFFDSMQKIPRDESRLLFYQTVKEAFDFPILDVFHKEFEIDSNKFIKSKVFQDFFETSYNKFYEKMSTLSECHKKMRALENTVLGVKDHRGVQKHGGELAIILNDAKSASHECVALFEDQLNKQMVSLPTEVKNLLEKKEKEKPKKVKVPDIIFDEEKDLDDEELLEIVARDQLNKTTAGERLEEGVLGKEALEKNKSENSELKNSSDKKITSMLEETIKKYTDLSQTASLTNDQQNTLNYFSLLQFISKIEEINEHFKENNIFSETIRTRFQSERTRRLTNRYNHAYDRKLFRDQTKVQKNVLLDNDKVRGSSIFVFDNNE